MTEQSHNTELVRRGRMIRFGRSRFSWFILCLVMVASIGLGTFRLRSSYAATSSVVSGRVTDATTGYGIPNINLSLCHNVNVITNANGEWSITMPIPSRICAMYVSGAPSTFKSSVAINLPPDASVRNLYEYQITGYDCYHNTTNALCDYQNRAYDRAVDTGYDLKFTLATPYTPPPTPAPTPVPTPTPVPQATATPVPGGGGNGGSTATATPAAKSATPTPTPKAATGGGATADHEPPAAPGNFRAVSSETNALVTLSWDAAKDNVGVSQYEIDRSTDGSDWKSLSHEIKTLGYQDTSVAFGVTYIYRIRAVDVQGNASLYAQVTAHTATFITNTREDVALSSTSDDSAATIYTQQGTFVDEAQCSVILGGWNSLRLDSDSAILAGPYQFLCKDSRGNPISKFVHPVKWSITPRKSDLKLGTPQVFQLTSAGRPNLVKNASYDAKTKTFTYLQTANDRVIVLASQQASPVVVAAIVLAVVIILLIAGITFATFQRRRIESYKSYLRDKYYNL